MCFTVAPWSVLRRRKTYHPPPPTAAMVRNAEVVGAVDPRLHAAAATETRQ
jgi:hypothetical protein